MLSLDYVDEMTGNIDGGFGILESRKEMVKEKEEMKRRSQNEGSKGARLM